MNIENIDLLSDYKSKLWNEKNVIYCYTNKLNGKKYVGQTTKRIKDRHYQHINPQLDKTTKKPKQLIDRKLLDYGIENFSLNILHICDEYSINMIESHCIYEKESLVSSNGYNMCKGGSNGNTYSEKTEKEMESIKRKMSKQQDYKKKKIICLNNNEIYESAREAERKLGILAHNICSCCNKKLNNIGIVNGSRGVFMYYDDYIKLQQKDIDDIVNNLKVIKKVVCLNFKEVYESPLNAFKESGVKDIEKCCIHNKTIIGNNDINLKTSGKHLITGEKLIWVYYEDYLLLTKEQINKIINKVDKRIICLNNKKIYGSLRDVEKETGIANSTISKCVQHKLKSAGKGENGNKLVWMYYREYLELYE